ncbi:MAG: beta-lactamase family protein [Myxococcales bacterium]|nr:MAG: beta-lactamase family protein [Myxococcales bacterium]
MTADVLTRIERTLQQHLDAGCEDRVFPGASACVATWQGGAWSYIDASAGVRAQGSEPVASDTVYDLASLTKPWVAIAALRLHQAGLFELGVRVDALIPEATGLPVGARTWEEVLSHRSGLEAWVPFYETLPEEPGSDAARAWILAELLPHWDGSKVGTSVYSDLGYILAGVALSRASGMPLNEIVTERVALPIGVDETVFFGASRRDDGWKARCAPTGWSPWRERILVGEVHDDNCSALGGVAGHAGMFGLANSVARFGAACVGAWHGRRGPSEEDLIRHATAVRPGGTHRLGWDGKAEEQSAAGSLIDAEAFGHLGFTGTSLWCDPRRQLVVVLLTNRVAVSDDNAAIRAYRPVFHDAVIGAFDGR